MSQAEHIPLLGGHIALDFANTAGEHASDAPRERLIDYADVIAWARHAGVISAAEARVLERESRAHPVRASHALQATLELREAVYRVFAALAHHRRPEPADLARLHAARVHALDAAEPVWREGHGLVLRWLARTVDLDRPLYPIMLAANELLESSELARLRQCGNHPCGWLFIDTSRSGTRSWCSAAECGNESRVRRFRNRRAAGDGA